MQESEGSKKKLDRWVQLSDPPFVPGELHIYNITSPKARIDEICHCFGMAPRTLLSCMENHGVTLVPASKRFPMGCIRISDAPIIMKAERWNAEQITLGMAQLNAPCIRQAGEAKKNVVVPEAPKKRQRSESQTRFLGKLRSFLGPHAIAAYQLRKDDFEACKRRAIDQELKALDETLLTEVRDELENELRPRLVKQLETEARQIAAASKSTIEQEEARRILNPESADQEWEDPQNDDDDDDDDGGGDE